MNNIADFISKDEEIKNLKYELAELKAENAILKMKLNQINFIKGLKMKRNKRKNDRYYNDKTQEALVVCGIIFVLSIGGIAFWSLL